MLVERCWICLEQPAVTTATLRDGRDYPVCDICAAEQAAAPTPRGDAVSDAVWARIVGELS
ncbi:MAG: hypothetical protein ACR2LQ_13625 [Acidimicrobiales bacterium]